MQPRQFFQLTYENQRKKSKIVLTYFRNDSGEFVSDQEMTEYRHRQIKRKFKNNPYYFSLPIGGIALNNDSRQVFTAEVYEILDKYMTINSIAAEEFCYKKGIYTSHSPLDVAHQTTHTSQTSYDKMEAVISQFKLPEIEKFSLNFKNFAEDNLEFEYIFSNKVHGFITKSLGDQKQVAELRDNLFELLKCTTFFIQTNQDKLFIPYGDALKIQQNIKALRLEHIVSYEIIKKRTNEEVLVEKQSEELDADKLWAIQEVWKLLNESKDIFPTTSVATEILEQPEPLSPHTAQLDQEVWKLLNESQDIFSTTSVATEMLEQPEPVSTHTAQPDQEVWKLLNESQDIFSTTSVATEILEQPEPVSPHTAQPDQEVWKLLNESQDIFSTTSVAAEMLEQPEPVSTHTAQPVLESEPVVFEKSAPKHHTIDTEIKPDAFKPLKYSDKLFRPKVNVKNTTNENEKRLLEGAEVQEMKRFKKDQH